MLELTSCQKDMVLTSLKDRIGNLVYYFVNETKDQEAFNKIIELITRAYNSSQKNEMLPVNKQLYHMIFPMPKRVPIIENELARLLSGDFDLMAKVGIINNPRDQALGEVTKEVFEIEIRQKMKDYVLEIICNLLGDDSRFSALTTQLPFFKSRALSSGSESSALPPSPSA